jgi:hypothetical protein
VRRLSSEKQSIENVNNNHDETFPEEESEDVIFAGLLSDEKGTKEGSDSISREDGKGADGADQKYLVMREPNVGKFIGAADNEAETQRAEEGSEEEEVEVDVDEEADEQPHDHACLA